MKEKIEARIAEYEAELVKIVSNHTAFTGALGELKNVLNIISDVSDVVAPEAAPVLNIVDEVLTDITSPPVVEAPSTVEVSQ